MAEVAHLYQRHPHGAHGVVVAVCGGRGGPPPPAPSPAPRCPGGAPSAAGRARRRRPPSLAGAWRRPAGDVAGLGPCGGPAISPPAASCRSSIRTKLREASAIASSTSGAIRDAQAGQGPGGVDHRAHPACGTPRSLALSSASLRVLTRGWRGTGHSPLSPARGRPRWYRLLSSAGAGLAQPAGRLPPPSSSTWTAPSSPRGGADRPDRAAAVRRRGGHPRPLHRGLQRAHPPPGADPGRQHPPGGCGR